MKFSTMALSLVLAWATVVASAQPQPKDRRGPEDEGGPPGRPEARDSGERPGPPDRPGDRDLRPRPPRPLIALLDEDKDGELSAEEIAGAAAALKELDEDGDGTVSREELRASFGPPPGGRGPRFGGWGPGPRYQGGFRGPGPGGFQRFGGPDREGRCPACGAPWCPWMDRGGPPPREREADRPRGDGDREDRPVRPRPPRDREDRPDEVRRGQPADRGGPPPRGREEDEPRRGPKPEDREER